MARKTPDDTEKPIRKPRKTPHAGPKPRPAGEIASGVLQAKKGPKRSPVTRAKPEEIEELQSLAGQIDPDSPKHQRIVRFIDEYPKDLNATQAAIRAGYSKRSAQSTSSSLLSNPIVAAAIKLKLDEIAKRNGIEQDLVMQTVKALVTGDTNELVEYRRNSCRYCWGEGHLYQFTPAEFERHKDAHVEECDKASILGNEPPEFDPKGGVGFNPKREPHPECPECFGDGVGQVFIKDTRHLSEAGKVLYAGAKVSKDGEEIKLHDRIKGLEMLARHEGFYNDKVAVDMSITSSDELDAIYAKAMEKAQAGREEVQSRNLDAVGD